MTDSRGPIVVDTDVFSAVLTPESTLARRYDPILLGRPVILCFQTVAELSFGALRRGWGNRRLRQLDAEINRAEIVHSGPQLVATYVNLRLACEHAGTPWANASMTPTGGSPPRRSASASRSSRTTGSSRARQDFASSRRTAERSEALGPKPTHQVPHRHGGSC